MKTDVRPALSEAEEQEKPSRASRTKKAYSFTEADEGLLRQLPLRYAEILRQQGSMKELATRLQIPLGTVKSRIHRARAAFDELAVKTRAPRATRA